MEDDVNNQIEKLKKNLNGREFFEIDDSKKKIKDMCYKKAHKIYGENIPQNVEDRLNFELDTIIKNNFESIYLIYSDIIYFSNDKGYKIGVRGNCGDSLVAYLLGLSDFNPIDYNLPFEFFAGNKYDKKPDIELNVAYFLRKDILIYLGKKYGKERVIVGELDDIDGCSFDHPSHIIIFPKDISITDYFKCEVCKYDGLYRIRIPDTSLEEFVYFFNIIPNDSYSNNFGNNSYSLLYELEKETGVDSNTIDLNNKKVWSIFLNIKEKNFLKSINGIENLDNTLFLEILNKIRPKNINDLARIYALIYGTYVWDNNVSKLIDEGKSLNEVISNREDMYNIFIKKGIDKDLAYDIVKFIWLGKVRKINSRNLKPEYKKMLIIKWKKYKEVLNKHGIADWYINSAEKVGYLYSKAHCLYMAIRDYKLLWYKVHYLNKYYESYFNVNAELLRNRYFI